MKTYTFSLPTPESKRIIVISYHRSTWLRTSDNLVLLNVISPFIQENDLSRSIEYGFIGMPSGDSSLANPLSRITVSDRFFSDEKETFPSATITSTLFSSQERMLNCVPRTFTFVLLVFTINGLLGL